MNKKSVEYFYNYYKNSISTIKKLETRLLKESYSFDKWSASLKKKSATIRTLYQKNEELIEEVIKKFVAEFENLPDDYVNEEGETKEEIADQYMTHIDFFMCEGYRDYESVVPVLKMLIPYYEEKGPKYRLLDAYYYLAFAVMEQREFSMSVEYFNKAIDMYPDVNVIPEDYRRFRIMCCHYFRLLSSVCATHTNQIRITEYVMSALDIWTDSIPVDFMTIKKYKGITQIIRSMPCFIVNKLLDEGKSVDSELMEYIVEEYFSQFEHLGNEIKVDSKIYVTYNKYKCAIGELSNDDYYQLILKKYDYEKDSNSTNFDYGESDFIAIFDDELLDELFAVESLFFMNPSYTYITYLLPEVFKFYDRFEGKNEKFMELKAEIKRYYSGMPVVYGNYLIDLCIENNIKTVLRYFSDVDEVIDMLEIIYVNRQVMTIIHSFMVSEIATAITKRILEKEPEIFVGHYGTQCLSEVKERAEDIISFVSRAGKVHDIGKVYCSDIINLQSRRITDEEFLVIKKHVVQGAKITDYVDALKPYRDIIIGHHKSYDGKTGYPENFANLESPAKLFIDLLTICDCVDAATDILGRNYARTKDFRTVLEELKEGAGKRYSKVLVDFIANDEEIISLIERYTKTDREKIYYHIYHCLIEPDVKFRPKDEKFVRVCRESDLDKVALIKGDTVANLKKYFLKSDKIGIVVLDGFGKMYGYSFVQDMGDGRLGIVDIHVDDEYRRNGYGSMMLEVFENYAKKEGYKKMLIPLVVKEHHDKFAWRNGFENSSIEGMMEKQVIGEDN